MDAKESKDTDSKVDTLSEHLTICVTFEDRKDLWFKLRKTTAFGKLMDRYCSEIGAPKEEVGFLFKGTRIAEDATPADLGMENDDRVEALLTTSTSYFF
mmetsp:Transcript_11671/g.22475  ORF Transcript_11671/g.22475 Transcript_11671/m.22475 type:complete len:99 (-) Transcript_11671:235-531(-)